MTIYSMKIKLSQWAKQNNITYTTAYAWFKNNKLPAKAIQTDTGTILVDVQNITIDNKTVLYARVSSHDQKQDLFKQIQRLKDYAAAQGIQIHKEYTEIGSGINPNRKQILNILSDKTITHIIVEHRDSFTRFGFELIEATLKAQDRKITVINQSETNNDLVQDMIDILTSFCVRLYGKRGARNRAKRGVNAIEK